MANQPCPLAGRKVSKVKFAVDIAVLDNIHMEDTDGEEDLLDAFKVLKISV